MCLCMIRKGAWDGGSHGGVNHRRGNMVDEVVNFLGKGELLVGEANKKLLELIRGRGWR